MATGTNNLSTIIENQFPSYISESYPLFVKFLQKYYEQLENTGQPLNLINNITKYLDIDTYTNKILKESAVLVSITVSTASFYTIKVDDSSSFPSNNGVIQIDNEIIFYQSNANNTFSNCYRNISGTTKLGDLYNTSTYITVDYNSLGQPSITHSAGIKVYNLSNLFLYAFTRNFQNQYLSNFPEQSLKSSVDKSTLIKNIKSFYRAKGTEKSIQFLFNSIVSTETDDIPHVIYPKDYTLKSSGGNWINIYGIKVSYSGSNITDLIGQQVTQNYNGSYSFATVDDVSYIGNNDGENIYLLVLAPETVVGSFQFASKTFLTSSVNSTSTYINVYSTLGWNQSFGNFLIGGETINFSDKTINQFIVPSSSLSGSYSTFTPLYNEVYIEGTALDNSTIRLIPFGVLYDLNVDKSLPYCSEGDNVQISKPGFFSLDPKVTEWLLNESNVFSSVVPTSLVNVSAIFQDNNYFYITSSGFPDYAVGSFSSFPTPKDQKNLKLIKKTSIVTNDINPTPNSQVGVLVNGVPLYSYKDTDSVTYNNTVWIKNRFVNLSLDSNYGYYFNNNDVKLGYGYGQVANPAKLRIKKSDNLNSNGNLVGSLSHSKILGFAYDGFPIYGPYGYSNANDATSSIIRMTSSYTLNNSRLNGPSTTTYPLGTFIKDYTFTYRSGTLDKNNGRFCVTPEYPNGTYAYFVTLNNNVNSTTEGSPAFPYIIGENFYGIPTSLNYTGLTNQNNFPSNVTRYRTSNTPTNGVNTTAVIDTVNSGGVDSIDVEYSPNTFSINCPLYFNNTNTQGSNLLASVSSLKGKSVTSLQSKNAGIVKLNISNAYLYDQDTIKQQNTNAVGTIIGNVFNDNKVVIQTISGTFNSTDLLNSFIKVSNLSLNQSSSYTQNSIITLTNGTNVIASGIVLYSTYNQNILTVKVTQGSFIPTTGYYIKSSTIGDTIGSLLIQENSLSQGIKILSLNDKIALVKTETNHGLSVNDKVTIDIIPDDTKTTTNYYVRKRIYQDIKLNTPSYSSAINDTGIGSGRILNYGNFIPNVNNYTFTNVELIFNDQTQCRDVFGNTVGSSSRLAVIGKAGNSNNAKATVVVSNGFISSVNITFKGYGYKPGDILTISLLSFANINVINKFESILSGINISGAANVNVTPKYAIGSGSLYTYGSANIDSRLPNFKFNGSGNIYTYGNSNNYSTYKGNGSIHTYGNAKTYLNNYNGSGNFYVYGSGVSFKPLVVNNTGYGNATLYGNGLYNFNSYQSFGTINAYGSANTTFNPINLKSSFLYEVLFVGFSSTDTSLRLSSVKSLSINDTLSIESEVVKVISIDNTNSIVTVLRGQENTSPVNHYTQTPVTLKDKIYRFPANSIVGSATAISYDSSSQTLTVAYDISKDLNSITSFNSSSIIIDQSFPLKSSFVASFNSPAYKFEFSQDKNIWQKNPIINIQKYYNYKFDTSDSSLIGSFFEISPSINHNIFTDETLRSSALPGSSNSWISIKLGFGNLTSDNNLLNKQPVNYTNYYYYDPSGIISSDNSYLNAVEDSLQGKQTINYITSNYFAYDLNSYGQYDGTGIINYTTTSSTAIGQINEVSISSNGIGYKTIPLLLGSAITPIFEAKLNVIWNKETQSITEVILENKGLNYINPVVVISDGDGTGELFTVSTNSDGSISSVGILNGGKNFSYQPTLKIIESDVVGYCNSSIIGSPKTIKVTSNGSNFENDTTIQNQFTSAVFLILNNFSPNGFLEGEKISQYNGSNLTAQGYVSQKNGWRNGSNILKVENVTGVFVSNRKISGSYSNSTGNVYSIFNSVFSPDIKTYYDNQGYYSSDTCKIGDSQGAITDSYYYQDYSYAIKSKTQINNWRDLINQTVHPAGFKLFGEMEIDSYANANPINTPTSSITNIISVWNPEDNKVTLSTTTFKVTQTIVENINTNSRISTGSGIVGASSSQEINAYQLILLNPFNGYINSSGNAVGTQTFTLYSIKSNTPISPYSVYNLIVTLDGVLQQPGVSFTLSNSQITFANPPLVGQNFVCYYFTFKNSNLNTTYFKQIKDISSQFNGSTFNFNLLYNDNSSVQLSSYENLIVGLGGILQKAGITSLIPINSSYYINRTVTPNQIVFSEPPVQGQNFFGYDIGKYNIYTIIQKTTPSVGPFSIISPLTGNSPGFVSSEYALVFVNNILQNSSSYQIIGENINFFEILEPNSDVYIVYWYGQDSNKSFILFGQENPKSYYIRDDIFYTDSNTNLSQYANVPYEITKNDSIRIHGEKGLRKILSDPYSFTPTEYRNQDTNNFSYSATAFVENYNGESNGIGLEVIANIQNGTVTSLTWNKKDYSISYSQPNNYGYEDAPILVFVSQPQTDITGNIIAPPTGGGAKGYAICVNGEVIDIVLTNGGSEYVVPPLVYITQKFDIIKSNSRRLPTETVLIHETGIIDYSGRTDVISYQLGQLGNSFGTYEGTEFIELGSIPVSSSEQNIQNFSFYHPSVVIDDFTTRKYSQFDETGIIFNAVTPSINEYGAYLQNDIGTTDTTIYIVGNLPGFPLNGFILLGNEIIYYDSILTNKLLNCVRGVGGTIASTYSAGDYLRTNSRHINGIYYPYTYYSSNNNMVLQGNASYSHSP
jgi:hypothetical protein